MFTNTCHQRNLGCVLVHKHITVNMFPILTGEEKIRTFTFSDKVNQLTKEGSKSERLLQSVTAVEASASLLRPAAS